VLIQGETGTGKELLARAIHDLCPRREEPFIAINCGAFPDTLLESELFGYKAGAFTDAVKDKPGHFALAEGGTILLDEIGDLSPAFQVRLLRVLQDHTFQPLGGTEPVKANVRVIAASNSDLGELVKEGRFRQDLFYRLNTFTLRIPPLRERPEGIFDLADHYLRKYNKKYGARKKFTARALEALQSYPFPGNVRELKNVLKNAVVMSEKEIMDDFIIKSLQVGIEKRTGSNRKRKQTISLTKEVLDLEKKILKQAMIQCKSTREIARYLGTSQPTIVRKMKKHGLSCMSIQ